MATATPTASSFPPLDGEEATLISPELGEQLMMPVVTDQVIDDIATSAVRDFLASLDPQELELRALSRLGGPLGGEQTVGEAMVATLRELAGIE